MTRTRLGLASASQLGKELTPIPPRPRRTGKKVSPSRLGSVMDSRDIPGRTRVRRKILLEYATLSWRIFTATACTKRRRLKSPMSLARVYLWSRRIQSFLRTGRVDSDDLISFFFFSLSLFASLFFNTLAWDLMILMVIYQVIPNI